MLGYIKEIIRRILWSPRIFDKLARLFRSTAYTGQGSDTCLKHGYLPVLVHFYSPIPDIKDLEERKVWDKISDLPGIDFRVEEQVALLLELGSKFSDECRWPLTPSPDLSGFYVQNQSFSYGCAAVTHSIVRHFKPNTVVEIGSGMSSRVISRALGLNRLDERRDCNYAIVDPYPEAPVKEGIINTSELIEKRVELLDTAFFERLKENDVLFIDSGHCVRTGGDVNYLFLEVLPRLSPGVVVHVHDINLPYEMPKVYATNPAFRQFWTEQYLLQSFLCFNSEFEVLLSMAYLMNEHLDEFRKAFPHYEPEKHVFSSGSFWMRRKAG